MNPLLEGYGAEEKTGGYRYDDTILEDADEVVNCLLNEGVIEEVDGDVYEYDGAVYNSEAEVAAAILSNEYSIDEWSYEAVRRLMDIAEGDA